MRLTRQEAIKYIKENYTEEYLTGRGIPLNKNFQCLDYTFHKNKDKKPSMRYHAEKQNIHCFTCNATYDILDLIGIDYGLKDFNEKLYKACEMYNITLTRESTGEYKKREKAEQEKKEMKDLTEYFSRCNNRLQEVYTDDFYLAKRGISLETCNRFNIGLDEQYRYKADANFTIQAVIIPTGTGSYTPRNIDRSSKMRFLNPEGIETAPFNLQALDNPHSPIFIAEGEIDGLSIEEVGGTAVGLGGTGSKNKLLQALDNYSGQMPIILALDNDDAGRKASSEIAEKLKEKEIKYYVINPYGRCKDANEMLQADRRTFTDTIRGLSENPDKWIYENTYNASKHILDLKKWVEDSRNTPPVSTGYSNLDDYLEGGLHEGLIMLGAVSSLGKSSFILQMADYIAEQGTDVLYFSLEMSRVELMAKSISRLTYLNSQREQGYSYSDAKTTTGILDGSRYERYSQAEQNLISLSVRDYGESSKHLYIAEGVGSFGVEQIKTAVERHITITGNRPVVFVDYLQILAPYEKLQERQNIDKQIMELKRLSRDNQIPVVVVSSFNRNNYGEQVAEVSFKESGNIEYSSDVLIGLQYKGTGSMNREEIAEAKSKTPREIELHIIKNRNGRTTGTPIDYCFEQLFNYYYEA